MRRALGNLLLALASLAVALGAAELGLRWLSLPGTPIDDPLLGRRMRPGGDWDARGFRNPRALEQADIVALGDSQTMGWNAKSEEAWPLVLGEMAGTGAYSMALAGYGPVQYAHLANQALELRPKLVLIGFYLGNDIYDAESLVYQSDAWKALRDPGYNGAAAGRKLEEEEDVQKMTAAGARPGTWAYRWYVAKLWLREHSRLYAMVANATKSVRQKVGVAPTSQDAQRATQMLAEQNPDKVYLYAPASPLSTTLSPLYRFKAVDLEHPQTREGWRITQDRLRAAKSALDSAGVPLVVVLLPTKEKIYLEYMRIRQERIPDALAAYQSKEDEVFGALIEFCKATALRCVSVLQPMVDALGRGIRVYDETIDGHPQAPGYRVIAQHLHRYLLEQRLLSSAVGR